MVENCLFVGGPADGERRVIANNPYSIRIASYNDAILPLFLNAENAPDNVNVDFQITVYHRRPFSLINGKFTVCAPDDLTDYDIFMKLINGYNPDKEKHV
jgi:hypothetical protein